MVGKRVPLAAAPAEGRLELRRDVDLAPSRAHAGQDLRQCLVREVRRRPDGGHFVRRLRRAQALHEFRRRRDACPREPADALGVAHREHGALDAQRVHRRLCQQPAEPVPEVHALHLHVDAGRFLRCLRGVAEIGDERGWLDERSRNPAEPEKPVR
jgi:hypothetical protein